MPSIGSKTYDSAPARKVAFLGLGVMGLPMAGHLARAGTRGDGVQPQPRQGPVLEPGVRRTRRATPREAAQGAQIASPAWATTTTCAASVLGPDGAFAGMAKGAVFVDHTTASADVARELYAKAKSLGWASSTPRCPGGRSGRGQRRAHHHARRRAAGLRGHQAGGAGLRARGHADRRAGRGPARQDGEPGVHRRRGAGLLGRHRLRPGPRGWT